MVFNLGVGVKTKLVELKTIKKLYIFILIIDKKNTLKLYVFPGNLKDYLFELKNSESLNLNARYFLMIPSQTIFNEANCPQNCHVPWFI